MSSRIVDVILACSILIIATSAIGQPTDVGMLDRYSANNGNHQYLSGAPIFKSSSGEVPKFEGQISTEFYIFKSCKNNTAIKARAEVTLRMYNYYSIPIYPPNFRPMFMLVHLWKRENRINYWECRFGHFSNGQTDTFVDSLTSMVNVKSGNFSTNYISASFGQMISNKHEGELSYSVGYQFNGGKGKYYTELEGPFAGSYGQHRILLTRQFTTAWHGAKDNLRIIYRNENAYIFGNVNKYKSFYNFGENRFSNLTRLTLDFQNYSLSPFIQYYVGRDYYNVRYVEQINTLSIGISILN